MFKSTLVCAQLYALIAEYVPCCTTKTTVLQCGREKASIASCSQASRPLRIRVRMARMSL